MLLNCLETETSSFNLRYLLHLIEVYVFEDVAFCPGLVGVVVKTIQEKVSLIPLAFSLTIRCFCEMTRLNLLFIFFLDCHCPGSCGSSAVCL